MSGSNAGAGSGEFHMYRMVSPLRKITLPGLSIFMKASLNIEGSLLSCSMPAIHAQMKPPASFTKSIILHYQAITHRSCLS